MSNNRLNANLFIGSSIFQKDQLFSLLRCFVDIYRDMISKQCKLENREEMIRDRFFCYLDDDRYRNDTPILQNFHFEKEPQEGTGYVDIKVKTINPYYSVKAYYSIECKRLDSKNLKGDTGLNAEYVKNGICRFVTDYYSSYFGCNVMFGFLVESVDVRVDIVGNINLMLKKHYTNAQKRVVRAKVTQQMQYKDFTNGYPYSYISKHQSASGKELTLYHLMFDFSQNIQ